MDELKEPKIILCHVCNKPIIGAGVEVHDYDGENITVCTDCAVDYEACYSCNDKYHKDNGTMVNDHFICGGCLDDHYRECRDCGEWLNTNDTYYDYDDDYLCESCYSASYFTCYECEHVCAQGDGHYCDSCEHDFCQDCNCDCDDGDGGDNYEYRKYTDTTSARECTLKGDILTSPRLVGCEIETEIEGDGFINDSMPSCVGLTGDGSLEHGVEIITPPLRLARLENLIKEVCNGCDKAGLMAKTSCGLHIHLDASDFKHSDIKIKHLLQTYFLTERVLYDMLPASRQRGTYCKPLANRFTLKDIQSRDDADLLWYIDTAEKESIKVYNPDTGEYIKPNKKQLKDKVHDGIENRKGNKMDSTRYHGLNIHGIFFRGAVELRYHSGTTNADKILKWIKINQAMVDYAVRNFKYKKLMEVYQANDKDRIAKFCNVFNLDSELKKYIKERTHKFNGDAYANDDDEEMEGQ